MNEEPAELPDCTETPPTKRFTLTEAITGQADIYTLRYFEIERASSTNYTTRLIKNDGRLTLEVNRVRWRPGFYGHGRQRP